MWPPMKIAIALVAEFAAVAMSNSAASATGSS
jgi:hypothetical protein